MICEKCNKNVGYSILEQGKKEKTPVFTQEIEKCKCGAVFCRECIAKMIRCYCCGKEIKKDGN